MKSMESNDFKLNKESLLIARDKPCLKKVDSSLLLELFLYNISGSHMFYHILSQCAYTIVVCSVFNIMLQYLYFIKNRMYEQHLISF